MREETKREALERQYENGGLSYADFARLMNEAAIEELTAPQVMGTLKDDGGDGGEGARRRAEQGDGPA